MIRPKTFERGLHRWDKWGDSIEQGRKLLSSKTALEDMKLAANKELEALGFAPCPIFQLYWLCCVFSDYGKLRKGYYFNKITVPDWFPLPFGLMREQHTSLRGERIYPPYAWSKADMDFFWTASWSDGKPAYFDPETCIVLPNDHPVRSLVRGRPTGEDSDGAVYFSYLAKLRESEELKQDQPADSERTSD